VLRGVVGLEENYAQQLAENTDDDSKFLAILLRAVLLMIRFYVRGWKMVPGDSFQNISLLRSPRRKRWRPCRTIPVPRL
jgi:hypothetical protein